MTPNPDTGRTRDENPGRKAPRFSLRTRESIFGIVLILPVLAAFLVVIAVPLARGVSLGFQRVQQITLKTTYAGFDNFARVLGIDGQFLHALKITAIYSVGCLTMQIAVGVAVAVLLNQKFFGRGIARALIIFPYLVPVIVTTTVWRWLLNDTYGLVNEVLQNLHLISAPIAWFSDPDLALLSVMLVGTWRVFPFVVIALLGRMQAIPQQLYDAARTDGASNWSMFWDITLPQLRSVLVIVVFLRFIWEFNDFNTVALLTGGGPANRTLTLPMYIYQLGFSQHQLGLAAAVADLALMTLMVVFALYFWRVKPMQANA
ncbi:MAG: sugar ABC transporter permease [Hyphomicrobiales bacterium]|nr:sugar ABC transporter permease [Hyphomicrobiales bacterium]